MKGGSRTLSVLFASCLGLMALAGCGGGGTPDPSVPTGPTEPTRAEDTRRMTPEEFTLASLSATDALGRTVRVGDERNGDTVGMFYFVWQGAHTRGQGLYNISELSANNPDALWNIDGTPESPLGAYHYWGEPLYGYYCSDDPWIAARHVELLTMAGIDYLVCDFTNAVVYDGAVETLLKTLANFQAQGFAVPKIAFYTNSYSAKTVRRVYEKWYRSGRYRDLWFSFDGARPLIVGRSYDFPAAEREFYTSFFDFRESQWPNRDTVLDREKGFPWMDWEYPQTIYDNGTVSVSLAQHPGARMSAGAELNRGRGFDYKTFQNVAANTRLGTNFDGQWQTVFDNRDKVSNVFVTGFNEWIAIKKEDGLQVFFVDTFNEEYSRDIEMMKGGYGDNYYLQTADYAKRFRYTEARRYLWEQRTVDLADETLAGWQGVRAHYRDFAGDTLHRDFRDAAGLSIYRDDSGRNDITDVWVTHDEQNLYVLVNTAEAVTTYDGGENWMNLLISTDQQGADFAGYQYLVNRRPQDDVTTVERSRGGWDWEPCGTAAYVRAGNTLQLAVPLAALGVTADNCCLRLKVADHVTKFDDITNYYVSGDSAPIGRLGYQYGY